MRKVASVYKPSQRAFAIVSASSVGEWAGLTAGMSPALVQNTSPRLDPPLGAMTGATALLQPILERSACILCACASRTLANGSRDFAGAGALSAYKSSHPQD